MNSGKLTIYLLASAFIAFAFSSCIKTKTCNIEINEEEMQWFPYDSNDIAVFQSDSGRTDTLSFTRIFSNADDEVYEETTCQARAFLQVGITDSSGQTYLIGLYQLLKSESNGNDIMQSSITFNNLYFFQENYTDDELLLSATGEALATLDSLTVGDTVYRNVQHIRAADSLAISNTYFKDIFFSENFRILGYDVKEPEVSYRLIEFINN